MVGVHVAPTYSDAGEMTQRRVAAEEAATTAD
jgi:hypothetical protein